MAFNLNYYKEATDLEIIEDGSLGIMKWGTNNAFPQTLKNLIKKSGNAHPAVSRTSKFYKGAVKDNQEDIVHPSGVTLSDAIQAIADDYAALGGFAIQVNYNLKCEITDFRPMQMETLRLNSLDEINYSSKIAYHSDFGRNSPVTKMIPAMPTSGNIKFFNRFNPNKEIVMKQILEAGGIDNYPGQILYYSNAGASMYPTPVLLPQINYVLSDVENSVLVRKETATGFINSYILKTTLDYEDPTLIAFQEALESAQGARGTGKVIVFSGLSPEDMTSTMLESIDSSSGGSSTIIESAQKTYDLDKEAITSAYLIPPALGGSSKDNSAFTSDELKNAYFVFNAITADSRKIIQNKINSILKYSTLCIEPITIDKLTLDEEFYKQEVTVTRKEE